MFSLPTVSAAPARIRRPAVFSNADCLAFGKRALALDSMQKAARALSALANRLPEGSAWSRQAARAARMARAAMRGVALPSVFAMDGNSKLPFAAFATLSIADCPDAGPCAAWCYSRKAWRYPAAYFRQLLGSLLMRHAPELIREAFRALPEGIVLRLYTDGDFRSEADARFWFRLLAERPDVRAYGYSKAWDALHAARDAWPDNYVLNLSTGGKPQRVSAEAMKALPGVRGVFAAVPVERAAYAEGRRGNIGAARYDSPAYHAAVRRSALPTLGRVFSCPGRCGDCRSDSGKPHACGDIGFKVPIAIGVH